MQLGPNSHTLSLFRSFYHRHKKLHKFKFDEEEFKFEDYTDLTRTLNSHNISKIGFDQFVQFYVYENIMLFQSRAHSLHARKIFPKFNPYHRHNV